MSKSAGRWWGERSGSAQMFEQDTWRDLRQDFVYRQGFTWQRELLTFLHNSLEGKLH